MSSDVLTVLGKQLEREVDHVTSFNRLKTAYNVGRILGGALLGASIATVEEKLMDQRRDT
jgi:sulfite exporter TauE/SafE